MRIAHIALELLLLTASASTSGAPERVGPSFDCSKATHPLEEMICAYADLSRTDLRFVQAYQALRQQVGNAGQRQLKQEALDFQNAVLQECGVPQSGPLMREIWGSSDCIKGAYEKQRFIWASRLMAPASEEASRPIERHIRLKRDLEKLGFLNGPGLVAGVYGPATRAAIVTWQRTRARAVTGLLGEADALALELDAGEMPQIMQTPTQPAPVDYFAHIAPIRAAPEATDRISLVEAHGVYKVPVLINGVLSLQFVLDSGATDVSLPAEVFLTLKQTGTIADEDYIGRGEYQLADGSIAQSPKFFIHELKVGNHILTHVAASITDVQSPLLLGQSFLKRFASVEIDNGRNFLALGPERTGLAEGDVRLPSDLVPVPPGDWQRTGPARKPAGAAAPPTSDSDWGAGLRPIPPPAPVPEKAIDLWKLKFGEITQPYSGLLPEKWQIIITNFGDYAVSDLTIGYTNYIQSSCPRSPEAYDGLKRVHVRLAAGDSATVIDDFGSRARYFCILAAR